jgi:hypothetical protein
LFARAAGSRIHASMVCALAAMVAASASVGAQVVTQRPPTDTARADTTVRQAAVPHDSIKTPFAVAEAPVPQRFGRHRWSRDQIFQTGAVNVAELIARVPGASLARSGFVMSPQIVTWHGETGRVRVFLDGIELDVLNPREGTVRDLGAISIFELEEVIAEPSPAELRVHLRTWRVARTTAETRVDVLTGDLQTNLYRGYFGRRFQSGLGLQFGFEQIGTQQRTFGGDGDGLGLFGRLGWARKDWSVDFVTQRERRSRKQTNESEVSNEIGSFDGKQTTSYLRLAFRSHDSGSVWAQLIAVRDAFAERSEFGGFGATADSADTNIVRPQYIATGGVTVAGIRVSAAARMRHIFGENYLSPSVRASYGRPRFSVQAFAEHDSHDSTLRADAGFRFAPIANRIVVSGQAGMRITSKGDSLRTPVGEAPEPDTVVTFVRDTATANFLRAEVGVRWGGMWFYGGVIQRDSVVSRPPLVFEAGIRNAPSPRVLGQTFGLSGAIYKDFGLDVHGVLWEGAGYYRPRTSVTGRVYLESDWLSQFPQGHFTIRASLLAEYRSKYLMPLALADTIMTAATPMTSMLEIRIKSATISWQFRNLFGANYETIPGFKMPSRLNLYGVRWTFTN